VVRQFLASDFERYFLPKLPKYHGEANHSCERKGVIRFGRCLLNLTVFGVGSDSIN
jgi:hypothetical protein